MPKQVRSPGTTWMLRFETREKHTTFILNPKNGSHQTTSSALVTYKIHPSNVRIDPAGASSTVRSLRILEALQAANSTVRCVLWCFVVWKCKTHSVYPVRNTSTLQYLNEGKTSDLARQNPRNWTRTWISIDDWRCRTHVPHWSSTAWIGKSESETCNPDKGPGGCGRSTIRSWSGCHFQPQTERLFLLEGKLIPLNLKNHR